MFSHVLILIQLTSKALDQLVIRELEVREEWWTIPTCSSYGHEKNNVTLHTTTIHYQAITLRSS